MFAGLSTGKMADLVSFATRSSRWIPRHRGIGHYVESIRPMTQNPPAQVWTKTRDLAGTPASYHGHVFELLNQHTEGRLNDETLLRRSRFSRPLSN